MTPIFKALDKDGIERKGNFIKLASAKYTCPRCNSDNTKYDAQNNYTSNDCINISCEDCGELGCTYYIDGTPLFNITSIKDARNYISDAYSKRVDEIDIDTLMVSFDNGEIWFSSFETDSLC